MVQTLVHLTVLSNCRRHRGSPELRVRGAVLPASRVPGPGQQHGGQGVLADPRAQALANGAAGPAPLPPLWNHA